MNLVFDQVRPFLSGLQKRKRKEGKGRELNGMSKIMVDFCWVFNCRGRLVKLIRLGQVMKSQIGSGDGRRWQIGRKFLGTGFNSEIREEADSKVFFFLIFLKCKMRLLFSFLNIAYSLCALLYKLQEMTYF